LIVRYSFNYKGYEARMRCESDQEMWVAKDMGGGGPGLYWRTVPKFVWRYWTKLRKPSLSKDTQ